MQRRPPAVGSEGERWAVLVSDDGRRGGVDPKAVRLNTNRHRSSSRSSAGAARRSTSLPASQIPPAPAFEIRYTRPASSTRNRSRSGTGSMAWTTTGWMRRPACWRSTPRAARPLPVHGDRRQQRRGLEHHGAGVDIDVIPPFWRTWWFVARRRDDGIAGRSRPRTAASRGCGANTPCSETFSQQLIDSLEHERRRISIEMHDSLGQDLTVIKARARASQERASMTDRRSGRSSTKSRCRREGLASRSRRSPTICGHISWITSGSRETIDGMVRRVARTSRDGVRRRRSRTSTRSSRRSCRSTSTGSSRRRQQHRQALEGAAGQRDD